MSKISIFHPFFGNGVFSTDKIMQLIKKGEILWKDLNENQIQPNTIDVKIGKVKVYNQNSQKINQNTTNPDNIKPDVIYAGEKDEPIIIPSRSWAEIEIHDNIQFDQNKYVMDIELRSGRGRLQLLPGDNMNFINFNGARGMGVFNMNPNDIVLYGQDRFAQAFFNSSNETPADGKIIHNENEIKAIAEACGVESLGPYLKFTPGNKVLEYKNIGKNGKTGKIDTRKKYPQDRLFKESPLPYRLSACKQVLIQSLETISVPNNIGIRLLRRVPTSQESYSIKPDPKAFQPLRMIVNSGWVDSGYKGKITMQPFARLEYILGEITPICLAIAYKYDHDVSKPYRGNYQDQKKILNS